MSPIYGIVAQDTTTGGPHPPAQFTVTPLIVATQLVTLARRGPPKTIVVSSPQTIALTTLKGTSNPLTKTISSAQTVTLATTLVPPGPAFRAHKNGTNQTGFADSVFTQVTFGTEAYDVGGYFATNAWTPPAGYIRLMASVFVTGTIPANTAAAIAVYKDGAILQQSDLSTATGTDAGPISVVVDDHCNGSNAYTVRAFIDSTGTSTVNGGAAYTWFSGYTFP